jgi:alpha-tubulin suppressor-like RCC1 family protein
VDIACGKQFNVFVTESGKIFGQGNRLLKRFGMESEVPLVLPVKDDAKVLRAWASCATQNQELVIIEVELKDGGIQLWSAGRSEQGLLGQGGKTKETKVFAPLAYDHKTTKFVSVSVYTDHAMAIDERGGLWTWGSNLQHRAGLPHEVLDGVYSPTKVQYLEENNLKAVKVSCGFDHTLLLTEDKANKRRFFSIGKEETNFKHLGTTSSDAADTIFHEIIALQDFPIVDFSAASKYSMVIVGGEVKADDGLYEHELPDNTKAKGVLHFYKKGGKWQFLNKD